MKNIGIGLKCLFVIIMNEINELNETIPGGNKLNSCNVQSLKCRLKNK